MFGFQIEQQPLPFQAAAEANQTTRGSDHAVAGHNDRNRVAPVGRSHRANGARSANLRAQFRYNFVSHRTESSRSALQTLF